MSNVDVKRYEATLLRLEEMIGCYRRRSSAKKTSAFNNAEAGYRESAQFDKGQAFALEYVADELDGVLASFKDLFHAEVSADA